MSAGETKEYIKCLVSGTDSTDTKYLFNPYGYKVAVEAVLLCPNTSVSTHASNYITGTLTANDGSTTLATHTTNSSGGAAMTAGTSVAMTMGSDGVGKALEIPSGGKLTFAVTKSGTGPAYNYEVQARVFKIREGV